MKERIKQQKVSHILNVQRGIIQRKVKAILQDKNGNKVEGISASPRYLGGQNYFYNEGRIRLYCAPLYNLFCKNVNPKDVGEQRPRPIWQCAEPHALGEYVFTYSRILNTDNLKSLHFTSIKDDRGIDGGKEYDIKPCAVCEQWIDSDLNIRENIIPQGLKNESELRAETEKKAMIESEERMRDSINFKFLCISFLEKCTRENGKWVIDDVDDAITPHIQLLLTTCEEYYSSKEDIDDVSFYIQRDDAMKIVELFLETVK